MKLAAISDHIHLNTNVCLQHVRTCSQYLIFPNGLLEMVTTVKQLLIKLIYSAMFTTGFCEILSY